MSIIISEIKARSINHEVLRQILKSNNATFKGTDHQVDHYFQVPNGRLKLREGKIENNLIFYERANSDTEKISKVLLYNTQSDSTLKEVLTHALGVKVVVDKQREIYFIDNIKFHIDTVKELGTFVEIEAIDDSGKFSKEELHQQCQFYMNLLKIEKKDLISVSYSDLILMKTTN